MSTQFPDAQDDAREITADTMIDPAFLKGIDDQIQALGRGIVQHRTQPFVCAFPKADPDGAALPAGMGVALKGTNGAGDEPVMVPATAANLAAGARLFGLLVDATPPGFRGRVAVAGVVPKGLVSIAGSLSYKTIRANITTGLAEAVVNTAYGMPIVGRRNADGSILIRPRVRAGALLTINFDETAALAFAVDDDGVDQSAYVSVTKTGTGAYTVSWSGSGASAYAATAQGQSFDCYATVSSVTANGCVVKTRDAATGAASDDGVLLQVF